MADLLAPDPLPDAKEWKREIFLHIDALMNPKRKLGKEKSAWAEAWSYRYGTWGRQRPDRAAMMDLLMLVLLIFVVLELTSYSPYAMKFTHWFRTKILRRPALDVQSVAFEQMIYRMQAAVQGSLEHQRVFSVDPFEGLAAWERMYGMAFVRLCVNAWQFVVAVLVIYILWFVIKYWTFVVGVVGGGFMIMLNYFIKLALAIVISILPTGIRKFFRLKPKFPSFIAAVREIRDKHINWWIQMKILGYFQKLFIFKEKTYGRWKRALVEEPVKNIQTWYARFKKVHVDLAYLDFLRIVVALHPVYAGNPETKLFEQKHGLQAANRRFFTTVSKALHWSRKKKARLDAIEKQRMEKVPEWWRYIPVAGFHVLLLFIFGLSLVLWMNSMMPRPISWEQWKRTVYTYMSRA